MPECPNNTLLILVSMKQMFINTVLFLFSFALNTNREVQHNQKDNSNMEKESEREREHHCPDQESVMGVTGHGRVQQKDIDIRQTSMWRSTPEGIMGSYKCGVSKSRPCK